MGGRDDSIAIHFTSIRLNQVHTIPVMEQVRRTMLGRHDGWPEANHAGVQLTPYISVWSGSMKTTPV